MFHIWSEDSRHSAFTQRDAGRTKVWSVESKRDVDAASRRFDNIFSFPGERRSVNVDDWLRRDRMLESLLARRVHNRQLVKYQPFQTRQTDLPTEL